MSGFKGRMSFGKPVKALDQPVARDTRIDNLHRPPGLEPLADQLLSQLRPGPVSAFKVTPNVVDSPSATIR